MGLVNQQGMAQITADRGPATTPAEQPQGHAPGIVSQVTSQLGFLAGGLHPEAAFTHVSNALVRASDSLRGPNGGMVPQRQGTQAPGPAGSVATAQSIQAQATAAADRAKTGAAGLLARVRSTLGI